ncbi:hypothetical protein D8X30_09355 [Bordetella pertussis]|uniref:hypothetical protein n=1 Tax=Bordetella pertussis TaxID=520 RepID=UPI000FD82415|nr:hypothetical protein CG025_09345 [Bordetella pertussis]AZY00870.1 hypothetical protein CX040_09350 [Bordetella pertussis]QFB03830.1 hypothetical protein D8X34_09365 [Bordetella pertussis]QFB07429.1 hypothetical protein D8X33_09360 [Bordetella pertussis]QFB11034.1 hypothetical protein D8X32_09365 [Bordetella pertussis]
MNWGVGDFQFLKSGSDEPCIQPIESSHLAEARPVFQRAPWATVAPGLLLAVTVLAVNLLGDGLRDSLDPKLARRAND